MQLQTTDNMLLRLPLSPFILLLLSQAILPTSIGKRKCLDNHKCGQLQIPYPFGVGSNCAMNPSFNIICNNSTAPPKPYINISNGKLLEVIEINSAQIRVKYPYLLAATCYKDIEVYPHKNIRDGYYYVDLEGTQYALSDQNWLTALGCDDTVAAFGVNNKSFAGGCVSFCMDKEPDGSATGVCPINDENGYSAGIGCCRSPIPKGTTTLYAQLSDATGKWIRNKYFQCSYAFVQEKQSSIFKYPFSDLEKSTRTKNDSWVLSSQPPVVRLDWRVGAENCSEARRNKTYACKQNSDCVDFEANGGLVGYHCRCSKGYTGNPYLHGDEGCKDIDECIDNSTNPCASNSKCDNGLGYVNCSCPPGFFGDGYKGGTGCTPSLSNTVDVFIGVGSGLGFFILIVVCFLLYVLLRKRRNKMRKEKFFKHNGGLLLQQQINEGTSYKTKHFSAEELEKATDDFNESRILGQGGQGTVYKGMLSDGKIVAIKKSKLVNKDYLEQFINEVVIVSQINHKNVVKLWGCCLETEVPLLVYELVPNGTLFDLIHDANTSQLAWSMRMKIAADVAGALAYLHSALPIPIYHRDIKSKNILLDEKYTVKLTDFGISRSVARDQTHFTTLVKGTFGYFDPEYFQSSQFTEKSDVYSFGVVLVELLTGQRPISQDAEVEERSLVIRFLESMEENNFYRILDPQISKHGDDNEIIAVASLAARCLNFKGKMRPTMKEVATELESLRMSEEGQLCEAKSMVISDIEYGWTPAEISPSLDTYTSIV